MRCFVCQSMDSQSIPSPNIVLYLQVEYNAGIFEALREKVSLLGELDGILSKFHILKIEFLHEKIIFFGLDFFLTRYGYVAFKNEFYNPRES